MKLDPPTRPREMLELLRFYEESAGLATLLDQIDWNGVTPLQIYCAILGRLPEQATLAVPGSNYCPRTHAEAALLSDEFQRGILKRVLDAFPEKRRLLFVHVPKCAGTDLIEHLNSRSRSLSQYLTEPAWTSKAALFSHMHDFVRNIGSADSIFVSGHIPLQCYLDHSLYRYGDRLFAVVRHPHEMVISQVNYVFKRFFEAPWCHHPDTRGWADALGLETFDTRMAPDDLRDLAFRILQSPEIVNYRNICTYLGSGTAESAFQLMARCYIELTEVGRYNAWLEAEWGIKADTRANQSRPVLKSTDLDPAQRQYLAEMCEEDAAVYNRVMGRMASRSRVSGWELI